MKQHEKNLFTTQCRLCESSRIHYAFISHGYPVSRCNDCGFLFLNPQPSDEVLAQLLVQQDEPVHPELKHLTAQLYLRQIIRYVGEHKGQLLEIGCGQGEFLAIAQEYGFDVTGIDISETAVQLANARLKSDAVKCGTIDTVDLPAATFDICVLIGMLEHVRHPPLFLQRIYTLLKPNGVLFLVTPSLDSWSANLLKNQWIEFKTEHLHYFNRQTLQNALTQNGFQHIYITPDQKYVTINSLNRHLHQRNILWSIQCFSSLTPFIPKQLRQKVFKMATHSINVLARKGEVRHTPRLSIIVPVYNEKANFPVLMQTLVEKTLPGVEKEIVLVESNSTDGTRDEVLQYQHRPGIIAVLEDKPMGKGHAVRTGLQYATGEFIMIQDSDLEYDINDYDQLLEPLVKYQKAFVLGSRHAKGWKMRQFADQPFVAIIMNMGQTFFTLLLNLFCWRWLNDPFTMYKLFRRDCLFGLTFKANRFDFDFELVMKLLRKGYAPLEIPINYTSRSFKEGKKVSFFRDPPTWLKALVQFRFEPLYKKRYEKE